MKVSKAGVILLVSANFACGRIEGENATLSGNSPASSTCNDQIASQMPCGTNTYYKYVAGTTVERSGRRDKVDGCYYLSKTDAFNSVNNTCNQGGTANCDDSSLWQMVSRSYTNVCPTPTPTPKPTSTPTSNNSYRVVAGDELRFEQKTGGGSDIFRIKDSKWFYQRLSKGPTEINFDPDRSIKDLRFGDFNGDGITDIFAVSPTGQWLVSYSGKTTYQKLNNDSTRTIEQLRIGDFNGDGKSDIFAVENGQWMYSSGGVSSYIKIQSDGTKGINELRFGDFDGDKKTDVFSVDSTGRWRFSSGGQSSYINLETDPGRSIDKLRFADFDGNGRTDVFTVENGRWLVSYDGKAKYAALESDSQPLEKLYFIDVDSDNMADIFTIDADGNWKISTEGKSKYIVVYGDFVTIDDVRTANP